ncbi:endoglucanase E-4 [Folsomia candida]|uniref:Endoglucanase n=1 Tax=Folsomia candida TaxID=158441 RepID=A0A226E1P8_FOLCA|nr:endoglucanase E-4 [Folsomia candida]OXA51379.1 Endoglucanase E-4 [Folsomia candida]
MQHYLFVLIFVLLHGGQFVSANGRLEYVRHNSGNYEAKLYLNLSQTVINWEARFTFEFDIDGFMIHNPGSQIREQAGNVVVIGNAAQDQHGPGEWSIDFYVRYCCAMPQLEFAVYNGEDLNTDFIDPPPPTVRPTRPPLPDGDYHYEEVLGLSIEFYEAQRSGRLPESNRIMYRGDSFLDDKDGDIDLVGGYFDAGDHVKFGFPFAYFTTVLNWGIVDYKQGYESAGELQNALDAVKWSLDYFIKAHPSDFVFYGQTGDGGQDHGYWGRPEDWTLGARNSYKITQQQPGSELAGEAAAAFASGYLAFKDVNPTYASTLLNHATTLYDFANQFRGTYTDAIPAGGFYNSWSGYGDELGWAAAWLYRATNVTRYLDDVATHWQEFNLGERPLEFSWDDKKAGLQVLLARITNNQMYKDSAEAFCDYIINDVRRTPKGLVWLSEWGSLRHSSNVAFICLQAADVGIKPDVYRAFAKQQINYALGDGGRSFVVGFGVNPPKSPHHRSSSCPNRPSPCDYNNGMNNPGPNYQTLWGALVGGPGPNDDYVDDRGDYIKNEVATDYNAAFQGALAALQVLKDEGTLP